MLRLLEWLRQIDASLLTPAKPTEITAASAWGAALAIVGGLLVLGAGLALGAHAVLQLALIAVGMVLTVPYVQDVFDKAAASVRE
jgi:hypothetical protein